MQMKESPDSTRQVPRYDVHTVEQK